MNDAISAALPGSCEFLNARSDCSTANAAAVRSIVETGWGGLIRRIRTRENILQRGGTKQPKIADGSRERKQPIIALKSRSFKVCF